MAKKKITQCSCDRCGNIIEEVEGAVADEDDDVAWFVLEILDGEKVRFVDVCPKCKGRIGVLVSQIKLEKAEKVTKTNGVDEPAEPPPVEEPEEPTNVTA